MARLRNIEGVKESKAYSAEHPEKIQVLGGFNVRRRFRDIEELASDILERGVDNPLWVRRDLANAEQPFILIDGERRHRALTLLFTQNTELELRIPVRVFDVNEEEAEDLMIRANMQRQDFCTSEKVALVKRYQKRGLTPKEIADRVGMSVGWVDQMVILSNATSAVRGALDSGKIGVEAALMLSRKTNQDAQDKVLASIITKAKGKRSATAKVAAEVTGTARRPGKKEVVNVITTLAKAEVDDDVVPVGDVRKLLILALNFAAGEEDREALVQACIKHLNLKPAPELPTEPKTKRGPGRPTKTETLVKTAAPIDTGDTGDTEYTEDTENPGILVPSATFSPATPEDFGEF